MTKPPMNVLAVCLGNICRSPMAEGLLRHHIQQRGLRCKVDSAGTSAHHVGEHPDRRAQQEMRRHGIDISRQTSRQLVRKDFDRFDWILVMDHSNLANAQRLAGNNEAHLAKIKLFAQDGEVPDPYYGGAEGFSQVYDMVNAAAEGWVLSWQANT
ncbi:MAG TPA: protein tyrosine phosphatase [Flavobacteriales bacterium]|nr:protein tyrosine phosphatase [Flavobacteriales bacterium]